MSAVLVLAATRWACLCSSRPTFLAPWSPSRLRHFGWGTVQVKVDTEGPGDVLSGRFVAHQHDRIAAVGIAVSSLDTQCGPPGGDPRPGRYAVPNRLHPVPRGHAHLCDAVAIEATQSLHCCGRAGPALAG